MVREDPLRNLSSVESKLAYQRRVLTVTSKAYRFTSNPFRLQPEVVESSRRNLGDIKVGCDRGDCLFSVSKTDLSVTVDIHAGAASLSILYRSKYRQRYNDGCYYSTVQIVKLRIDSVVNFVSAK